MGPNDAAHPTIRSLQWIIAHLRRPDGSGGRWNASSLSVAAGLARGHVGNILSGAQGADLEWSTATKIARAAGVSTTWLLTNKGEPGAFSEEPGGAAARTVEIERNVYTSLAQFLILARKQGLDADILEALQAERNFAGDPGPEHWRTRYAQLEGEKVLIGKLGARGVTDADLDEADAAQAAKIEAGKKRREAARKAGG